MHKTTSAETNSSHDLRRPARFAFFTRSPRHGFRETGFQGSAGQRVEDSAQGGPEQGGVPGLSAGSVPGVRERLLRPRDLQTDRGLRVRARGVLRKLPRKSLCTPAPPGVQGIFISPREKALTRLSKVPVPLPSSY